MCASAVVWAVIAQLIALYNNTTDHQRGRPGKYGSSAYSAFGELVRHTTAVDKIKLTDKGGQKKQHVLQTP